MKRPIMIIAIGYLTGIIGELYFKKSLVPFFIIAIIIISIFYFLGKSNKRLGRIVLLFFNNSNCKIIILFLISFLIAIGQLYIINEIIKEKYNKIENNELIYIGTIVSEKKKGKYKDSYIVNIKYIIINNNRQRIHCKCLLRVKKADLDYGDSIQIKGTMQKPSKRRNYKGFSYEEYLKSQGIIGIINTEDDIKIVSEKNINFIQKQSNNCRKYIINTINDLLPNETKDLVLGFLLGYTDDMSNELKEEFRIASLSHMLAVSGAHISYIILGVTLRIKGNKNTVKE